MIPKRLQGLFWSNNIANLDLDMDRDLIIHQILTYGSSDDLKWLNSIYQKEEIRKIFIGHPKKNYTAARFNFVKNYLLEIRKIYHTPNILSLHFEVLDTKRLEVFHYLTKL